MEKQSVFGNWVYWLTVRNFCSSVYLMSYVYWLLRYFSRGSYTWEHASESPGGLVKTDCLTPSPEFLMQWVWNGAEDLRF